jgi:hypothetical protein
VNKGKYGKPRRSADDGSVEAVFYRPQGRIKGLVVPCHFSSLVPFGDSKSIVGNTM